MDIGQFDASLLAQSVELLRQWYPAGKLSGQEYRLGGLDGSEGESLGINTRTGLWADFATGQAGKGLLALYAAREGLKQGEAAKALGWTNGSGHAVVAAPVSKPAPEAPECPPVDAIPPEGYQYRDRDGALLFVIQRIEATETERKTFRPYTWRNGKWHAKAWPAPRPLFGLETLTEGRRVLLVEGEKSALAARQLLPMYTVMSWAGGAAAVKTADWSVLAGHDVDLWPDADEPGSKAMASVSELLLPIASKVRVLLQDGMPEGWDLADALAEGWDTARVIEHVKQHGTRTVSLAVGKPRGETAPIEAVNTVKSLHVLRAELGITTDSNGRPFQTESNVMAVLTGHPEFTGKIWLNEFSQLLMFDTKELDKVRAVQLLVWFQQQLEMHKLSLLAIERALLLVGHMNQRHPLKAWLEGLQWDGTARLDTLMADGFGAPQNDYSAAVGRRWLISLIARVYAPGCQADYMPVFEGSQGVFKSSAMRALGGEWFLEAHDDPIRERKDFLLSLQGHWLIEIPEMHAIAGRGNGIEKIKGMITNRTDNYREPYGVKVRPYPRQCVFAGTTNADQWNPDPTGGRRFWPIRCGAISLDYLRAQREQLFSEALAAYRVGDNWYEVPQGAALEEQDARRERDAWEDLILHYIARQVSPDITVAQILQNCLDIKPGDWAQTDQNRVARALRANGYLRVNATISGERQWVYRKSAHIAKAQAIAADSDDF